MVPSKLQNKFISGVVNMALKGGEERGVLDNLRKKRATLDVLPRFKSLLMLS